jgi:hypothetical protein
MLRLQITMSLDGFVPGPGQDEENPLGVGGVQLHEWFPLDEFPTEPLGQPTQKEPAHDVLSPPQQQRTRTVAGPSARDRLRSRRGTATRPLNRGGADCPLQR